MASGDSATTGRRSAMDNLRRRFDDCIEGRLSFTLVVEDPHVYKLTHLHLQPPPTQD